MNAEERRALARADDRRRRRLEEVRAEALERRREEARREAAAERRRGALPPPPKLKPKEPPRARAAPKPKPRPKPRREPLPGPEAPERVAARRAAAQERRAAERRAEEQERERRQAALARRPAEPKPQRKPKAEIPSPPKDRPRAKPKPRREPLPGPEPPERAAVRRAAAQERRAAERRAEEQERERRRAALARRPAEPKPKPKPKAEIPSPPKERPKPKAERPTPPRPKAKPKPRPRPRPETKARPRPPDDAKRRSERDASLAEAARTQRRAAARATERRERRRAIARQDALAQSRREAALAKRLAEQDELRRSNQRDEAAKRPRRQRLPNGVLSGQLAWLHTKGKLLLDELEQPVVLRGVTAPWLERAEPQGHAFAAPLTGAELSLLQSWGATAVTIPIAQDLALRGSGEATGEDYLAALDTAIAAAADAGLYTIVQLSLLSSLLPTHADGGDRFDPALPNPGSLDLWSVVAERYSSEAAVLYDLFRSPHDPGPGDALAALAPHVTWKAWNEWLIALLGAVRRASPRSVAILRGLARGTDLSKFPLRLANGTEPANVVYGAELGPTEALAGLGRLARSRPTGVFTWWAGAEGELGVSVLGRKLASAGHHWVAADWSGTAMPLVERRADGVPRPTALGRAFAGALAQPGSTAHAFAARRPDPGIEVPSPEQPKRDPFAPPGAPGNRWARFGEDGRIPDALRPRVNEGLALAYEAARRPAFQQVFAETVGILSGKQLGPLACVDALDKAVFHMAETAKDPRARKELDDEQEAIRLDPAFVAPPAFSIVGGTDVWIGEAQLRREATVIAGTLLHEAAHLAGAPANMLAEIALEAIHDASYPRR